MQDKASLYFMRYFSYRCIIYIVNAI